MEKRFCKDCIHLASQLKAVGKQRISVPVCRVATTLNPITGAPVGSDPMVKNAGFDCPDWTPKNGTRTARGPAPKDAPPPGAPKALFDVIFDDLFDAIFGKK